ncbi:hypothetical protein MP228_004386 [Amoeboaphelidium protococcarum]|nr:hypothetical protein MP228_004386 [Amoeboaphelidium protococcarum]
MDSISGKDKKKAQKALWQKAKYASVLLTPRYPIHDNRYRHPVSSDSSHLPLLENMENGNQVEFEQFEHHQQIGESSMVNVSDDSSDDGDKNSPNKIYHELILADVEESSWRHRLAYKMDSTPASRLWEIVDLVISFLFIVLYIYNTTYDERGLPTLTLNMDFALAIVLLAQYLPKLYIAVDLARAWTSTLTLLTFASTVPVVLSYFNPEVRHSYMSAGYLAYFYPLRFVRLHVILMAVLIPSKTSILKLSLITRKAIRLVAFILFLVLTVAAFVHVVAYKSQGVRNLTFFDSFYFAIISVNSGNTSQIVPDGPFARVVVLYILITGAIFVPTRVAELLRLMGQKSVYDHSFKKKNNQNHVLICGDFELSSLSTFLKEFFCADHGPLSVNTHVVILSPNEPSEELKLILENPMYINRTQYVKGSVMNLRSLEKVRIKEVKACFIFSSKYATSNASEDDAKTAMRALALRKSVKDIKLHVQVLMPENKSHFDYLADSMVCTDELKLGMLAQNCRCPGLTTLMHLLTTSLTDKSAYRLLKRTGADDENIEKEWIREYLYGAGQEIYPQQVQPEWVGKRFASVSYYVFKHYGVVLFAIGVPNKSYYEKKKKVAHYKKLGLKITEELMDLWQVNAGDYDLYLNPADYVVCGNEVCFYIGSDQMSLNAVNFDSPMVKSKINKKSNNSSKQSMHSEVTIDVNVNASSSSMNTQIISEQNDDTPQAPTDGALLGNRPNLATGNKDALPSVLFENDAPVESEDIAAESTQKFQSGGAQTKGASQQNANAPTEVVDTPSKLLEQNSFVTRIFQQAMGFTGMQPPTGAPQHGRMRSDTVDSIDPEMAQKNCLSSDVHGHILVCDPNCSLNIEYFIAPLRSEHLIANSSPYSTFRSDGSWTPIVILTPIMPSDHQLNKLKRFEEVYIIYGNPMVRKDLRRAGVERCLKAVVLADCSKGKFENDERTSDAASLLTVLNIEAMAREEDLFIITEFIHYENMNFIGESAIPWSKDTPEYKRSLLRPCFMAGHTYSQNMLDSIICQNFYNVHMLSILRHIIYSGTFHVQNQLKQSDGLEHSHIWLVRVPPQFAGKTYLQLFGHMSKEKKAIPIGLYRRSIATSDVHAPQQPSSPGNNGNGMGLKQKIANSFLGFRKSSDTELTSSVGHHYVCANPPPQTILRADDRVYAFSVERPVMCVYTK